MRQGRGGSGSSSEKEADEERQQQQRFSSSPSSEQAQAAGAQAEKAFFQSGRPPDPRRFYPERTFAGAPPVECEPPSWRPPNGQRAHGEMGFVSFNTQGRQNPSVATFPVIEGIIHAHDRPIILLQEVRGLHDAGPDAALFTGFINFLRYRVFWGFNAVKASTGAAFTGTRGAAILVPLEHGAEELAVRAAFRQADVALIWLPRWQMHVACVYTHPGELLTAHIVHVLDAMPRNILIGGDFNRALDKTASRAESLDLQELTSALIDRNLVLIPPESATTSSRAIDGFICSGDNKHRVPISSTAQVLTCKKLSDHKPVAIGMRGVHESTSFYMKASVRWQHVTAGNAAHFNIAVLAEKTAGATFEDAMLKAAATTLPQNKARWVRRPTCRPAGYTTTVLDLIRRSNLPRLMNIFVPSRKPQSEQPLRHFRTGKTLVEDQEKVDAFEEMVSELLFNNDKVVARNFDPAVVPLTSRPLQRAEVLFAQRRVRPASACDKHGVSPKLMLIATHDTLYEILRDDFDDAWRGEARTTWLITSMSLIQKPGKNPTVMADRRPVTVTDIGFALVDRVFDWRLATDPDAVRSVHPSQLACMRNVPVAVQVGAVIQIMQNAAARDPQWIDPGFGARNANAARMMLPPEIRDQFPVGVKQLVSVNRVVASVILLTDQTSAYCRLPCMSVANELAKRPGSRQFIPYLAGTTGCRGYIVKGNTARSAGRTIGVGLGQGYPSSPRAFCIGTYGVAEATCLGMDFASQYLDDTNGLAQARDPYVLHGKAQRSLNNVGAAMDKPGLSAADGKCKALHVNFSKKPFTHHPGPTHYKLQGLDVPLLNPGGKINEPAEDVTQREAAAMRTARHLGVFLDPLLTMHWHVVVRLEEAYRALNMLVLLKGVLPGHALREAVFTKVLSKPLYAIEFVYTRLSAATRNMLERLMRRCARLITGACKNASGDLLLWAAGLPSFFYIVAKRVVRMDEKLICMSSDFDPDTGVYKETSFTAQDGQDASNVPMMAKVLLSEAEPEHAGQRRDPRANLAFAVFAKGVDMSAARGEAFSREHMLRSPISTKPCAGSLEFPLALIDTRLLRFDTKAPGGLKAEADPKLRGDAGNRKLAADRRAFGTPVFEIYTDGGALLQQLKGSAAAYAIWGGDDAERDEHGKTVPPRWRGVCAAGVAACSYTAEGTAVVEALQRLVTLRRNETIASRNAGEKIYVRFVMDSKSFADALQVGPLSQTEWLETRAYELIAELLTLDFSFSFIFVFGHCAMARNDFVDNMCDEFLEDEGDDTDGAPAPLAVRPMRLCDRVNMRVRGLHHYLKQTACPFGRKQPGREAALVLTPQPLADSLGLKRSDEMRLMRLRTGCAPEIGSVIHGLNEPCRQCKAEVMNRMEAVRHMFECEAAPVCKYFEEFKRGQASLHMGGDDTRPPARELVLTSVASDCDARAVLGLAALFVKPDAAAADAAAAAAMVLEQASDDDDAGEGLKDDLAGDNSESHRDLTDRLRRSGRCATRDEESTKNFGE